MTVYVDDMRAPYGRMIMCHMLADTDEELHAMAQKIGVARRWWQSPEVSSGSHYDIALSKRNAAVYYGAVEVTMRQCACMNARRRATGKLGKPEEAEEWFRRYREQRQLERHIAPPSVKERKDILVEARYMMAWGIADNESTGMSQTQWYALCEKLVSEIERLRAEPKRKSKR